MIFKTKLIRFMKSKPISCIAIILLINLPVNLFAQDFLQYFGGDKDSLRTASFKMIQVPAPVFKPCNPPKLSKQKKAELGIEQVYGAAPHRFIMRDGTKVFAQKLSGNSSHTIILLHGVGASGYLMNRTAGLLRNTTQADVYAIDFRGHGQSEGKKGDISYINQYADDVADIVQAIYKKKPEGKIVIAAHSMGGGIALRYAMSQSSSLVNGFILLAPLLGHNAPTLRKTPPVTQESSKAPFMKIHIQRIIGLKMLNSIGDKRHNHLPVLFLNLPEEATLKAYTYRANVGMAPDDYIAGLKAVKAPMLVLVGEQEEVFEQKAFAHAIHTYSTGQMAVIPQANHNSVRHSPKTMTVIKTWFEKHLGQK